LAIEHYFDQSWHSHDYWFIAGLFVREQQKQGWLIRNDELEAEGDPRQRQYPQPVLQQGGKVGRAGCWGQCPSTVPEMARWRVRLRVRPGPETGLEGRLSCILRVHPEDRTGDLHTSNSPQVWVASPKLTQSSCTGAEGVWGLPGRTDPVRAYGCCQDSDTILTMSSCVLDLLKTHNASVDQ